MRFKRRVLGVGTGSTGLSCPALTGCLLSFSGVIFILNRHVTAEFDTSLSVQRSQDVSDLLLVVHLPGSVLVMFADY